MKVTLLADGTSAPGTALVTHNERLADPLDNFTRAISAISKVRNKSEANHLDIARLEFLGGLYTNPALTVERNGVKPLVGIPSWNLLRCLQDGAKRQKRGMDVPRGIHPITDFATLQYSGPVDPEDLWRDGGFALRKTVGVQKSRTVRTRPIFTDWKIELEVEVDDSIWDKHVLATAWKDAGRYCGLGEMRPVYGRFNGVLGD